MSVQTDCIKKEDGMTLIEVMAALVLLSLLAVTLLSVFSTTGGWIGGAGKKTSASQYANSIIEGIRARSTELKSIDWSDSSSNPNVSGTPPVFSVNDSADITDTMFSFYLVPGTEASRVEIDAPRNYEATIKINRHDDTAYYTGGDANGNGIPEINGKDIIFNNNLYDVQVKIKWNEKGIDKEITISTVLGAS